MAGRGKRCHRSHLHPPAPTTLVRQRCFSKLMTPCKLICGVGKGFRTGGVSKRDARLRKRKGGKDGDGKGGVPRNF